MTNPAAPPSITPAPDSAPDSTNPGAFQASADAWVVWMKTFFTIDVPAFLANCYTNAVSASESATEASSSASAAADSAASAQIALSAVSAALGMTVVPVTGTAQLASGGNIYPLQNDAKTSVTLPSDPPNGTVVGVWVCNGRSDNVVAANGKQIEGLDEDLVLDLIFGLRLFVYIDPTSQWRIKQ